MQLNHIFKDFRGSIEALVGDLNGFSEIAILRTNAGIGRGGCIHSVKEYLCVLQGRIVFRYRPEGLKLVIEEKILYAGESITIQPNTPHYYISETDSIVLEWGVDPEDKKTYFKEFRDIVLEHNSNV